VRVVTEAKTPESKNQPPKDASLCRALLAYQNIPPTAPWSTTGKSFSSIEVLKTMN
jgi:hypothetical protein